MTEVPIMPNIEPIAPRRNALALSPRNAGLSVYGAPQTLSVARMQLPSDVTFRGAQDAFFEYWDAPLASPRRRDPVPTGLSSLGLSIVDLCS